MDLRSSDLWRELLPTSLGSQWRENSQDKGLPQSLTKYLKNSNWQNNMEKFISSQCKCPGARKWIREKETILWTCLCAAEWTLGYKLEGEGRGKTRYLWNTCVLGTGAFGRDATDLQTRGPERNALGSTHQRNLGPWQVPSCFFSDQSTWCSGNHSARGWVHMTPTTFYL